MISTMASPIKFAFYLRGDTLPSFMSNSSKTVVVDDRNPNVVLQGARPWEQKGFVKEYNTSSSISNFAGQTATLLFQGIA